MDALTLQERGTPDPVFALTHCYSGVKHLWCKSKVVPGRQSEGESRSSAVPSVAIAGSVESLSHTTSSPQPSPAASTHASRIADPSFSVDQAAADAAAEETPSESESVFLPDYLFLSNCESGKLSHNR